MCPDIKEWKKAMLQNVEGVGRFQVTRFPYVPLPFECRYVLIFFGNVMCYTGVN